MATLPMTQPTNPNQTGGASMSPSTPTLNGGVLGATVPGAGLKPGAQGTITGPGASTAGQPFGTVPTSGFQAPNISQGISTTDGSKTVVGDFKDTYGDATGKAIVDQLAGLGTSTNSAVQATNDVVLAGRDRLKADMYAQEAARGVSPDSSSAALYSSDFDAQTFNTLTATDANMELQGQNTLISTLLGEGQAHGADESGWDVFGDVLNAGAGIAGTFAGSMLGTNVLGGAMKGITGGTLPTTVGGAGYGGTGIVGGISGGSNASIIQRLMGSY